MELLGTELLSLIIACAILYDHRGARVRGVISRGNDMVPVLLAYVLYLVVAMVVHLHVYGLVRCPPAFARVTMILHTLSFPLVILIWVGGLERVLLSPGTFRNLLVAQALLLGLFSLISFIDLLHARWYVFSDEGVLESGIGVSVMLVLSLCFVVVGVGVVLRSWREMDHPTRLLFMVTLLTIGFSLLFFHVFRRPVLFAISSSFLLLMTYLFMQRRRLSIDVLTNIPNQVAFIEYMEHRVRTQGYATIMAIDIENFRSINERYGTVAGDDVLRQFSAYLALCDERSRVFRIAGNRFAIVSVLLSHNDVVRRVDAIKARVASGWRFGESAVFFHVNIAIVELPVHAITRDSILEVLENTLNEIKTRRRQSVIIFNKRMVRLQERRLNVLTALRNALEDEQRVQMHLQPIVDASSLRIVAAEALMRIQDPELGIIAPGEFIPIAERTGLISRLTPIMLKKVCRFLTETESDTGRLLYISVNISADDLGNLDSIAGLLEIIRQEHVEPRRIGFEVTESMLLTEPHAKEPLWKSIVDSGVRLMLDDFGTGYSNLELLMQVPFEVVKIDRSVASNSSRNFSLITMIGSMLEQLEKRTVAEGIESQKQLEFVQAAGITYVQGYYFSRPVPTEQFLDVMRYDNAL